MYVRKYKMSKYHDYALKKYKMSKYHDYKIYATDVGIES